MAHKRSHRKRSTKRSNRSHKKRSSSRRSKRRSTKRRSTKRRSAFKLSKHLEKKVVKIAKSPRMTKLQKLKAMDKLMDRAEKRHYK